MLKHSKQRDAIEQFLATRYDHPTAETVYLNLREDYPKISLATVYRNLSLLAAFITQKMVVRFRSAVEAVRTVSGRYFLNIT